MNIKAFSTEWVGRRVDYYDVIASTNEQAKKEAQKDAAHGTLIVADMQTAGKGRRGRSWESPAGTNIYFSLLLRPSFVVEKASMLTLVMAYSVCRAIRRQTGLECGIKWPNDLVIDAKKVCGILTELQLMEQGYAVIIGVGINVGKQCFDQELQYKATSLADALAVRRIGNERYQEESFGRGLQEQLSRELLLGEIMRCFEEDYGQFRVAQSLKEFMEEYNNMLVNLNRQVRVLDPKGEYSGIARGINEAGELLVETEAGRSVAVYAGEVSVRGIYGYV